MSVFSALPDVRVVVIRLDKVPYVDQSGLYAMEDAVLDLRSRGVKVVFTDLHGQPLDMFKRFNLVPGLVAEDHCFDDFKSCAKWLESYCKYEPEKIESV